MRHEGWPTAAHPKREQASDDRGLFIPKSGAEENRTLDLVIANDALYQLSYRPKSRRGAACRGQFSAPGVPGKARAV